MPLAVQGAANRPTETMQQLPERVVPSGFSTALWRQPLGPAPADPQQMLTHRQPTWNITQAIQSVWNAKEGRVLGSGPGNADHDGESASFPGWDMHLNDGVVTRVIASHEGEWKSTPGCTTPKAWLFLYGHYRTFDFTRHTQAAAMDLATNGCYFVVAAVWPVIAASAKHGTVGRVFPDKSPKRSNIDGSRDVMGRVTEAAMRQATSDFGGRLAFVILSRDFEKMKSCSGRNKRCDGNVRSSFSTAVPWHACWALARWAATVHGFRIDPYSTVLRTRPDFTFASSFDEASLRKVFERGTDSGRAGAHLALGSLTASDVFQIMSFLAFDTDIGAPLEAALTTADADLFSIGEFSPPGACWFVLCKFMPSS
jgi:hypothetical protein